ncbi:MAG: hypothetical protein KAS32_06400 [Candidatus Peribacteraceae bacterium]|nr:hypothetical protein [Candidatus Peribacteraceae bacterium]
MKSIEDIEAQIDLASDSENKFSGMTYEQGVEAALSWVIGDSDESPMDD